MKADQIRGLDEAEMKLKLHEMEEQMFRIRFQMSMGQLDGIKKYRVLRKDLARARTVLRERELAAAGK
ncbi:MAG: 50S ribosomal protein L29 [Bryobacteraceae bacterium]